MLRALKTEVFFNHADFGISSRYANDHHELSISLTWIKLDMPTFHVDVVSLFRATNGTLAYQSDRLKMGVFNNFVAATLTGAAGQTELRTIDQFIDLVDGGIIYGVKYIEEMMFVIENSPPRRMKVKTLASKASHVAIGTFLGYGLAGGNYPLMIITVPTAIVIVGSAVGVARGLENGLSKAIQQMLDRRFK